MLKYLLHKEFLQIRRNSFLPRLIVVFPIMIMCVMPWVMNMEIKNIAVEVVDNDHSTNSQRLVGSIGASKYFIFNGLKPSYNAALEDIEQGTADVVLEIPDGFGRGLEMREPKPVLIAANAVNGTKGSIGSNYLSQMVMTSATDLTALKGKISTLNLYNKHQNYKVYMIPALLAVVIMLMTGFLPALNIVGEKEAGTIEQINVTPVKKSTFILAKIIPYWIIALFVITVCLLLSHFVYGIDCQGSLLTVYVLAMLLALFFSSFGLIVSNYSDTLQQAVFVMWFFVVCLMLLSGLFTPTRSMPSWAYATTKVNPMSYFIEAIRTVFIRGGDFQNVVRQILALALISIATAAWAVASYKKNS